MPDVLPVLNRGVGWGRLVGASSDTEKGKCCHTGDLMTANDNQRTKETRLQSTSAYFVGKATNMLAASEADCHGAPNKLLWRKTETRDPPFRDETHTINSYRSKRIPVK